MAFPALLFLSYTAQSQVLTNSGAVISVTENTFVQGDTIDNVAGVISNEGTINLDGSYNNADTIRGNGLYNVKGNWRNFGRYIPGNSTVRLNGEGLQRVNNSGFGDFRRLVIEKTGSFPSSRILLETNVDVTSSLEFENGIVDADNYILFLSSQNSSSLLHTSGYVIGKFERGVNSADNYLFPLGSSANYNPLNLDPNINPSNGSVLSEFIPEPLDTLGLPLADTANPSLPGVEVYDIFRDGYWSLASKNDFSVADFDLTLNGTGFSYNLVDSIYLDTVVGVDDITRVLRRPAGGEWEIDGKHKDAEPPVAFRDNMVKNISSAGNHFAFGNVRPLIYEQPQDTSVCDGTEAVFEVVATGEPPIYYTWQEKGKTGWKDIQNGGIYSGANSSQLTISAVNLDMNEFEYRVRISHRHGHVVYSRWAQLIVNPLPRVIPTPREDTLCYGETTFITLDSDVAGTTFEWEVIRAGVIQGAADGATFTDGDTIINTLTNPTDTADYVVYRVSPTGPLFTFCEGHDTTVIVWVNPIPRVEISVAEDTLCDAGTSNITVTSPTVLTSGEVKYDFTVEDLSNSSGEVTGQQDSLFESLGSIDQTLDNTTDHYQWVEYRIHPYSIGNGSGVNCDFGDIRDSLFRIYVNPTPRVVVEVVEDTICDGQTSTITVTSPTELTSGEVKYDFTVEDLSGSSGEVTGQQDSLFESLGSIEQTLDNTTDYFQWVEYRIHPYTFGTGPGTNCDYGVGEDSVFRIIVNPTPNINVLISNDLLIDNDTIFCNGYTVDFELFNNQLATGEIKYRLEVTGDVGIVDGETPDTDSLVIEDFSNTLWHNSDTISVLNYRFIPYIEDARGNTSCYNGIDTTVVVKIVPELRADESPKVLYGGYNITCHGLSDGEILMTPVGGDLRYTYDIRWQDEGGTELQSARATSDVLTDLSAGIYGYAITDTIGCFFTDTFRITEPDTLAVDSYNIVSPQCYGDDPTGEIYVDLSGGVDINDYLWVYTLINLEVGEDEDLLGVRAGSFKLTFKDHFECSFDTIFRIDPANRLDADTINVSEFGRFNISCNGASDGAVEVTGLGGTGSDTYTYKWFADPYDEEPLSTDSLLSDVPAGTYYYWVQDGNGCLLGEGRGSDSLVAITLTEPDPITFHRDPDDVYPGDWDISCFGEDNGRINLDYRGGHTWYMDNSFIWTKDGTPFSSDSLLSGLTPGTYQVTVIDTIFTQTTQQGVFDTSLCYNDTILTLLEPPQITYDTTMRWFTGGNNISCFDRTDGFVDLVNVQGGDTRTEAGTYTYAWTPPDGVTLPVAANQDQQNLPAGKYYFTISDQIGCAVSDSALLTQPDSLFAIPDTFMNNGFEISCFNGSDGWVSVTPFGGIRPYSYEWKYGDDMVGTASDTVLTDLREGPYSVTITDPNGCLNAYEWQLEHPDTIVLNPDPDRLIECYGDTSTIRIDPEGGVGGYTYLWDGIVTTRDLNGAREGTYEIVLTDANGCVVTDSLYLGQRTEIIPEIFVRSDFNGKHISCYDSADARIELTVSGGNDADYTFGWNTGEADNNKYTLRNLPAGVYSVDGVDASGCPFTAEKEVIEPTDIDVLITTEDPLCAGVDNGKITLSVVGGTPFDSSPTYNYGLNDTDNLPLPEFTGLREGEYVVRVIDANGCFDTSLVEIVSPGFLEFDYQITKKPECPDETDGVLEILYIDGGTMPYYVNGGFDTRFENLGPGIFVMELKDGNGCILMDSVMIEPEFESCLFLPTAFTPNGDGANDKWVLDQDSDGTNDMYLYPDAELFIYDRWGELVFYTNNVADEAWDGTYRGRDLPVDTYHYVLDLHKGDNPPVRGSVTIVRER